MKKYIVIREWFGSKPKGSVVELESVSDSLLANLKEIGDSDSSADDALAAANDALKEVEGKLKEALLDIEQKDKIILDLRDQVEKITEAASVGESPQKEESKPKK